MDIEGTPPYSMQKLMKVFFFLARITPLVDFGLFSWFEALFLTLKTVLLHMYYKPPF